jgi:hypothetical protein
MVKSAAFTWSGVGRFVVEFIAQFSGVAQLIFALPIGKVTPKLRRGYRAAIKLVVQNLSQFSRFFSAPLREVAC